MGNNKVKSKGQLQGKKGNGKKDLHPQSRRVKQAARVDLREKRLKEAKKERDGMEGDKIKRLLFFVEAMDRSKSELSIDEVHDLVQRYLSRLDEDIKKEASERRPGRPLSKLQEELEAIKQREGQEYEREGLLMPDLTERNSVESARYWLDTLEGRAGYLSRLRLVRIFKGDDTPVIVQTGDDKKARKDLQDGNQRDGDDEDEDMDAAAAE